MTKSEVKSIRDDYFRISGEVYCCNRYVSIQKTKPEDLEIRKIITQRVEGVDSLCHEMNRMMLHYFSKLEDKAE